jgi:predicted transcriptional regulator
MLKGQWTVSQTPLLADQQRQALAMAADGKTQREIAEELGAGQKTICRWLESKGKGSFLTQDDESPAAPADTPARAREGYHDNPDPHCAQMRSEGCPFANQHGPDLDHGLSAHARGRRYTM